MQEESWNNIRLKARLYIISLGLLFFLMIPLTLKLPHYDGEDRAWQGWNSVVEFLSNNILSLFCLILFLLSLLLFLGLEYRWSGTKELPVRITEIKSENFEYLTFLTTYIVPLVCFDMNSLRYVIVLFILLVIIGALFVRSDFYLGNPILALAGYRLYRIQYIYRGTAEEKLVISKRELGREDDVEYIPFDQNTWYVWKVDEECQSRVEKRVQNRKQNS